MSLKLLSGVHIPHRKNTADMPPVRMPPPAMVTIPLSMSIGRPANCVVKPGDHVDVGINETQISLFKKEMVS